MRLLLRFLALLRLLPQPREQGDIDVSIRPSRRSVLRDQARRIAEGPTTPRGVLVQRVLLGLLVLAAIAGVVWALPADARIAVVVAVQVALLRISDVTLGVFRTTFVVRGRTLAAAITATLEALVWITAASVVLADVTVTRVIGFAGGVGAGTAIGVSIVGALRLGVVTVRVFAPEGRGEFAASVLRAAGQGATVFSGRGRDGPVEMILSVMKRREADVVCAPLTADPSFYVVIEGREANPRPTGAP